MVRATCRRHRHGQRLREDDGGPQARCEARRSVRRARRAQPPGGMDRALGRGSSPPAGTARGARRVGRGRLVPIEARACRARSGGHRRLARSAAACLVSAPRPANGTARRPPRGALERQSRERPHGVSGSRLTLCLCRSQRAAAPPALPARARALPGRPPPHPGRGGRVSPRCLASRRTPVSDTGFCQGRTVSNVCGSFHSP